jgi:glycosyltransferase involved in cell wall biosynthesis
LNVLLYSPELRGHPQVYCRVIGDILLEAGHDVVIAAGVDETAWAGPWRDLRPFEGNSRVRIVDTRRRSAGGLARLTAEELVVLQKDFHVESTLLVEGDHFEDELRRIADKQAPRLRGRTAGIFARTSDWYPREREYGGAPETLFRGDGLRAGLGRAKNRLWPGRGTKADLYERVLLRHRPLDAIVVKDERILERHGPPVFWMPEIYKVFGGREGERRLADWAALAEPIREYVARAKAENVLLFFGPGAWYKGYDLFLRLADIEPSIFALHAGAPERREPGKSMAFDTDGIRKRLLDQGRLFETRAYVESEDLVRQVFASIDRFVSTHRLTMSSGTMLQALDAGKPVLTPGSGQVGYLNKRYRLGMTYRYFDDRDLAGKWREFLRVPAANFAPAVAAFMERFSRDAVAKTFRALLLGETGGA